MAGAVHWPRHCWYCGYSEAEVGSEPQRLLRQACC